MSTPPRLGRGLAALLGDRSPDAPDRSSEGIHALPIELLEAGPFQPRQIMEPDSLEELTESIRARGILQPILARPHPDQPGRYQIIGGERRWRAAQRAGLHAIPVHVRHLADAEAMAASLVENLQRQDLNAIEEAEGLHRLMRDYAMTQEELAGAVGKSRSHVANTIRLLQLPASVRREVMNGALSAGHARALIGHPDPAKAALAVIADASQQRALEAAPDARPQGGGAVRRPRRTVAHPLRHPGPARRRACVVEPGRLLIDIPGTRSPALSMP